MLLERLLSNLGVQLHPFAVCGLGGGDRLPMPSQEWTSVHFVLSGRGELSARGHPPEVLRTGLLAIVPPGLPHAFHADSARLRVACGQVRVLYAAHSDVFARLDRPLVLDYAGDPAMTAVFEALLAEQQAGLPGGDPMMTALMNQCLVRIFRDLCDHQMCDLPWLQALEDPELAGALEAMIKDPAASHSLESLAETVHTSRSTFARRFTSRIGVAPMEYLRDIRLRHGAALLTETTLGIDAVARQVGFASRSHFSRAFTQRYGTTPSSWRHDRR